MTLMSQTGRRLALAVVAAVVLVMAAPFVGEVRSQIRAAFPERFSVIVNGAVGVLLACALGFGLARVRERRVARYGAMALAMVVALLYDHVTGSPDPKLRAVERVHFINYGIITFLFYRVWHDRDDWSGVALPLLAAFIVGIADEGFQWFLPARVGELKDVWLNGVVIGCGLLFSLAANPMRAFHTRWQPGSLRLTLRATALTVLALAAFVHVVHLGVEIRDTATGSFGSRYTAGELAVLDASRRVVWQQAPPLVRPARLSREDQFMTEGLQHVQERNRAWDAKRVAVAWHENLILERYFPAVLDTPSYVAKTGHRWSADQRADAAARAAGLAGGPYSSAAYPYPLYVWSPIWLWLGALGTAAVLGLAASGKAHEGGLWGS